MDRGRGEDSCGVWAIHTNHLAYIGVVLSRRMITLCFLVPYGSKVATGG